MWSKELKLICASFIVSFLHSMSAFCGARASSIVVPLVAKEIATARDNLALGDYPDPEGIKVGNVHFRPDEQFGVVMKILLSHEKNDAANRAHMREFTFTPLHEDNPYCPVKLGFLLLARRGVFNINPVDAWRKKEFTFKEEAKQWPLFCEADCSTKTLTTKPLNNSQLGRLVKTSIQAAGFNAEDLSHRSYRSGFATRFIIATAIENGGRFEDHHVDHLKRLGGWSQKSSVVHLYIKKVLEDYSDSAGLLIPGLRTEEEREDRLKNLPSAYNFRLQSPAKNITTETDAQDLFPEEYQAFLNAYGPLQKAKNENPSDVKKIASVKRNAVREFCKKKNMEQHEKRLELPPTPPKPETTRRIDVIDVLTTWEGESLPVHLDTRSRWIPPEGDSYPEQFNCPFRGCESTFASADECDNHVTLIQHSKQKVGNDKNWICRADQKSFHSLDCLRAHINKCHLPKRFHCDRCHYKTNQTGHLKRHRTNVHGLSDHLEIKKWRHEQ
ncbi:unnamed protein product [Porites evermanni]|uniref:C2H2-type domain-containing protein n=1 Tax=Porites evermanni TaxID=104178 RepID=A0ABN8QES6_9CNID|nr:unnamed protein product [Porites evermanni]